MTANIEQSVKTVSSNKESVKTISHGEPVSRQDQIQQAIQPSPVPQTIQQSNVLRNSTSMQSINSVLSTCSSSALPEPVKQGLMKWNISPPLAILHMPFPKVSSAQLALEKLPYPLLQIGSMPWKQK